MHPILTLVWNSKNQIRRRQHQLRFELGQFFTIFFWHSAAKPRALLVGTFLPQYLISDRASLRSEIIFYIMIPNNDYNKSIGMVFQCFHSFY